MSFCVFTLAPFGAALVQTKRIRVSYIQGLWSEWYESGRSVGCLGCSGTSDHNLGCLTLKGSLERQTEEHVRSIKRGLDVVLHVLVPVSGAKDSRPLVDIVLAYLNDPKGLLGQKG